MEEVDVIIEDGIIVTMDDGGRIIHGGAVAVRDGKILDVGKSSDIKSRYKAEKRIDARRKAVLPGFVNMHNHLWAGLIRSLPIGEGMKIDEYLRIMWRIQEKMRREQFYYGALHTCIENILSGVTTIVDHCYPFSRVEDAEATLDAFRDVGIRAGLARGIMTKGYEPICEEHERAFKETERLLREYANNPMTQILVAPVSFRQSTPEDYRRAGELARKYNARAYTHVSETSQEVEAIKKEYGDTPIALLHKLGFLDSNSILVHCIYPTEEEFKLLKETGAHVVHCPSNSMRLAKGVAPVPRMLDGGINVTLATDTPTTAKQDMFLEMYNAVNLHSLYNNNPQALKPYQALYMATRAGAKAFGMEDKIGSIEKGKRADIIVVDLSKTQHRPLHDVVRTIVFHASASDVETVMIDGRVVMENREIKTVDVEEVMDRVEETTSEYLEEAGIRV